MRIFVYKKKDEAVDVFVRRTRLNENPSRVLNNVLPDEFLEQVGQAIREVAPVPPATPIRM